MITFHIITLFPESLDSYLGASIIGRGIKSKKLRVKFYNPRDFVVAKNKQGYKPVDDRPYGGGPGMVLQAEPLLRAVAKVKQKTRGQKTKIILFTPTGKQFTNQLSRNWARSYKHLILICGRYEGIDERVSKILRSEKVSIGPYILTGGELPALAVLDTVARQIEGVLGKFDSLEEGREASAKVYTRPEVLTWRGREYRVPKILLSGHAGKIREWRKSHQSP